LVNFIPRLGLKPKKEGLFILPIFFAIFFKIYMQQYATLFHIFVIAKSKIYFILQIDKQVLAVIQQFKKIKLEFRYNISAT
jgi:hypothetical protein